MDDKIKLSSFLGKLKDSQGTNIKAEAERQLVLTFGNILLKNG